MITLNKKEQLFTGLYFVFQQLLLIPILLLIPLPLRVVDMEFLYFFINFVLTVIFCRRFLWENIKKLSWNIISVVFSGVFLYYVSSALVGILIQHFVPEFYNVNDDAIGTLMEYDFGLVAVGVIFLAPITEEVMYRGLAFGALYRRSKLLAYLVSVLVFSAIHVVGYIGQYDYLQLLLCLLQYVPASLCLCWAYAHTGNIFTSVLIHMIINTIGTFAMR